MGGSDSNNTNEIYDVLFVLQVMTRQIACSEYNRYFVLKGGTAFMSMLCENDFDSYMRSTHDIDLHVCSEDAWRSFKKEIVQLLNSNPYGVQYQVLSFKNRSTTSDSITLQALYNGVTYKVKIDMNVAPFSTITVTYLSSTGMNAYDCETMLTDKISAICSQRVFRRSKDLYDMYVLSQLKRYTLSSLVNHLKCKRPDFFSQGVNMLVTQNYASLGHAYDKYRGILNKPSFYVVYKICSSFIYPFFNLSSVQRELVWNGEYWV